MTRAEVSTLCGSWRRSSSWLIRSVRSCIEATFREFGRHDVIPAVNLLMQRESRRQRSLKIDEFSGNRVAEFQVLGVQEISSIAREAG